MLSGETAIGEYPFEAAAAADEDRRGRRGARSATTEPRSPTAATPGEAAAVAHAVADVATSEAEVVAITCYTETGRTARLLSAERPLTPIYAFMPDEQVRRVNALHVGRRSRSTPRSPGDTDEMIALMDEGLRRRDLVASGDAGRDGRVVAGRAHDHEHAEAAPWVRTHPVR